MNAQSSTWSKDDTLVIESVINGSLTLGDLFDLLTPKHSIHAIRKRYVWHGYPDEDTRIQRAAELGSAALARRCAESGGRFR